MNGPKQGERLILAKEGEIGEIFERIVVPSCRRKTILRLAHTVPTAGHMLERKLEHSYKDTTWPWITKDIADWCRTCPKCH